MRCVVVSVICVHKTEKLGLAFYTLTDLFSIFKLFVTRCIFCTLFGTLEFSLVNRKTIYKESASVGV